MLVLLLLFFIFNFIWFYSALLSISFYCLSVNRLIWSDEFFLSNFFIFFDWFQAMLGNQIILYQLKHLPMLECSMDSIQFIIRQMSGMDQPLGVHSPSGKDKKKQPLPNDDSDDFTIKKPDASEKVESRI